MTLTTVQDPAFLAFKAELERHRRMDGYYLIDLVSIRALREAQLPEEELLEQVFRLFDDQPWPPADQRPPEAETGTWADCAVEYEQALQLVVEALRGGPEIGHGRDTVSAEEAVRLYARFLTFLPEPRSLYAGLGFGDRAYAHLRGVVVVSTDVAGVLWVVD
jgi:hypothetical protein